MTPAAPQRGRAGKSISYEDSKALAHDQDPAVRAELAARSDLRPEVLYYLAADPSPEVRRCIAENATTPMQADRLLAGDGDETVRQDLARKLARLTAELDDDDREKAERYVVETLEMLARDQAVRVRRVLAETLRDLAQAPPTVIQRLARDAEEVVACPVLEFSPLLSDQDLIEIIGEARLSSKLSAVSRRRDLAAPVCDAIVATDDRAAITALLANRNAQIREETLDSLVEGARTVEDWQEPLVERPMLPPGAARKLAGFVARQLLEKLRRRADLDDSTARLVAEEVRRRLGDEAAAPDAEDDDPGPGGATAQELYDAGALDSTALLDALARGDRGLVRDALVLLSGLGEGAIARVLSAGSAKAVTALAWKAGLEMRCATQLQLRMGGIPPAQVLNARDGTDYPLTPEEMTWQLEFFESFSD